MKNKFYKVGLTTIDAGREYAATVIIANAQDLTLDQLGVLAGLGLAAENEGEHEENWVDQYLNDGELPEFYSLTAHGMSDAINTINDCVIKGIKELTPITPFQFAMLRPTSFIMDETAAEGESLPEVTLTETGISVNIPSETGALIAEITEQGVTVNDTRKAA